MTPASLAGHLLELLQLSDSHLQRSTAATSPEAEPSAADVSGKPAADASGKPADRIVSSFFRTRAYLGAKDRRIIADNFFGIVRHRRYLEALLERYVSEYPAHADLDAPGKRYLALFAVYHVTSPAAIVSGKPATIVSGKPAASVSGKPAASASGKPAADAQEFPEAKWKETFPAIGLREFTGWLSRNRDLDFLKDQPQVFAGVRHSFQDWMVEEWQSQFGDSLDALLASLNEPAPTALRVNTLKSSPGECRTLLLSEGIDSRPSGIVPDGLVALKRFNVEGTRAFKEGAFEVQDEGSQIVSIVAAPAPGMVVIDGCAGAGGKALHMAALMRNEGEIVAIDTDPRRLGELSRRALRSGATIIRTFPRGELLPDNLRSKGDIVLVDAPCSGSGTIRRNPWFKWSITEELVDRFAATQKEILSFNAQFVKPGGTLVYVTCSLFRKENEDVVEAFLAAHPAFRMVTGDLHLPATTVQAAGGFIRLAPHILPTDGFTMCVLRKA